MPMELPIRIGVAGLGRLGRFHFERLSLRRDFRVVALHDVDATRADDAQGTGCEFFADWDRFLCQPELEAVLLATPVETRAELAVAALAAGKQVVVENPLAASVDGADRMLATAIQSGFVLCTVNHRRAEDDFRAALQCVRGNEIGPLRAVQFVSWDRVGLKKGTLPGDAGDALIDLAAPRIDQLLHLVEAQPRQVFAQLPRSADQSAFRSVIEFACDVSAHVEVDRKAVTPLNTGWVVNGSQGGYANFRRYKLTDDGEIFDVPAPPPRDGGESTYDAILSDLNSGNPVPAATHVARNVVALLEALRESAERNTVVAVG